MRAKNTFATLTLVLSLVIVATAHPQENVPKANDLSFKVVRGFGSLVVLICDLEKFKKEWDRPSVDTPRVTTCTQLKRGERIVAYALFSGCMANPQGNCESLVDFIVYKPDGSVYGERKGAPLWDLQAPPDRKMYLSRANLAVDIEAKDPLGRYKVKVRVTDTNAKITFEVENTFSVVE